jgi:DNA-binding NtrC family response regulator
VESTREFAEVGPEVREILPMNTEISVRPVVLVIEDEALIRWALSEGLTESGYVVRSAGSAAEARTSLEAHAGAPMVVLLDLRLPDVADLSFLQEVRGRFPAVPVIMLTAHGSATDAAEAARLGAFRFVSKPFDIGAIVALVDEAWASLPRPV